MSDEPWVTATQEQLGAIIKAPKLQDKLLKKPPFRFLHDVVTSFIKTTNLLNGLYTPDELDSNKVQEKEAKIQFLQKLISTLQCAHNRQLAAKPTKIITGAEPEATNEMLQLLAQLVQISPDAVAAGVAAVQGGGAPAPVSTPPVAAAKDPPPQPPPQQQAPPPPQPGPEALPERPSTRGDRKPGNRPPAQAQQPAGSVPSVTALAPSEPERQARPGSASARKPPPSVKSNEREERGALETKPAAGVIVESRRGEDEDEGAKGEGEQDWMRLVEQQEQEAKEKNVAAAAGEEKTWLAKEALAARNAEEKARQEAAAEAEAAGAKSGGIVLKTKKRDDRSGAMGTGELSRLREQLQLLTKASNPLGKFLEAIHEDVDTMSRELEMWRAESRQQMAAASEAKKQTEEAMRDVNAQLMQIEDSITDQLQKINITRLSIQQNDQTIETLIRMVVNPGEVGGGGAATAPAPSGKKR